MGTLLHLIAFTPSHIALLQKSLYSAMGYSVLHVCSVNGFGFLILGQGVVSSQVTSL